MFKTVLFDFGGVIAEEGFYHGLLALGEKHGLHPEAFFTTVQSLIFETGYLTGRVNEATFWNAVRGKTGITGSDGELRDEILTRFVIRPRMVAEADRLRSQGLVVALLSDQTDWLEEIDQRIGLFRHFDEVFNSFRIHKSKRDASVFVDVCAVLGCRPDETLFVDDNIDHIDRARSKGLETIHFTDMRVYENQIDLMLRSGMRREGEGAR
jgi:putative hydrolase of the HAD superfamily